MTSSRREFIKRSGFFAGAIMLSPMSQALINQLNNPITIGLIADLHQDIMHDGEKRLDAFLEEMSQNNPDALIQLGDFAYPNDKNLSLINKFNKANGNSLHVIGNHDTDNGHTKKQCLDVWGIPNRYYVHELNGLQLIVLDGNDVNSPVHAGGYPKYIGKEQLQWLKYQLNRIEGPVVLASHQPLAGPWSIDNTNELQELLSRYTDKIILAVCGHTHIDEVYRIGGVNYFHVNSASYQWVGGDHKHDSYSREIHEKFPWIEYTCPYRDPVYAMISINPEDGSVEVSGKQSEWVGPSPANLGVDWNGEATNGKEIVPFIRKRRLKA